MLRRNGQVRHEDEEVEQAAENDGGGLLEEAGEHCNQWSVVSLRSHILSFKFRVSGFKKKQIARLLRRLVMTIHLRVPSEPS